MPGPMIEHHNPIGQTRYISMQHIERYRFACLQLRPGQRVLDIACGAGYGTEMLSLFAGEVIGADRDDRVVHAAHSSWDRNKLLTSDALCLPFETESFDVVVSFETIEHVSNGRSFLAEMHRVLRPGGHFICSTPNIRYTAHPAYHLQEYEPERFYELIRHTFSKVECYAQYFRLHDRIRDLSRWQMRPRIVSALVTLGLKETLKNLVRRQAITSSSLSSPDPSSARLEIDRILRTRLPGAYQVRPLNGTKLLRIMVAVAKKETLA